MNKRFYWAGSILLFIVCLPFMIVGFILEIMKTGIVTGRGLAHDLLTDSEPTEDEEIIEDLKKMRQL